QRLELFTFHTAGGVDGFNGGERAGLDLVSILGGRAGHGLGNADLDGLSVNAACEGHGAEREGEGRDSDKGLHACGSPNISPEGCDVLTRIVTTAQGRDGSPHILRAASAHCHYGYALGISETASKFMKIHGRV